jgi:hypothetical protein
VSNLPAVPEVAEVTEAAEATDVVAAEVASVAEGLALPLQPRLQVPSLHTRKKSRAESQELAPRRRPVGILSRQSQCLWRLKTWSLRPVD